MNMADMTILKTAKWINFLQSPIAYEQDAQKENGANGTWMKGESTGSNSDERNIDQTESGLRRNWRKDIWVKGKSAECKMSEQQNEARIV